MIELLPTLGRPTMHTCGTPSGPRSGASPASRSAAGRDSTEPVSSRPRPRPRPRPPRRRRRRGASPRSSAADAASRTLRVRIALPNPGGRLRPGLFARVTPAATRERSVLQVPDSAVIRTGSRTLVFVAEDGGRYRPVEVRLGAAAEGQVEVLGGLAAGQRIVESGQFLIDSEARLSGALAQFAPLDSNTPAAALHEHQHQAETPIQAQGVIEAVSEDSLLISHAPIAELGWGAMTMRFELAPAVKTRDLRVGDRVRIFLRQRGEVPVIERLEHQEHAHD